MKADVTVTARVAWYAKPLFILGAMAVVLGADPDRVAKWLVRRTVWLSVQS